MCKKFITEWVQSFMNNKAVFIFNDRPSNPADFKCINKLADISRNLVLLQLF